MIYESNQIIHITTDEHISPSAPALHDLENSLFSGDRWSDNEMAVRVGIAYLCCYEEVINHSCYLILDWFRNRWGSAAETSFLLCHFYEVNIQYQLRMYE